MAKKLTKKKKEEMLTSSAYVTITSREVAEMTDKLHKNVLKDIDRIAINTNLTEQKVLTSYDHSRSPVLETFYNTKYKDANNRNRRMVVMGERFGMLLMSSYSDKYRLSLIDELRERRQAALTWHRDRKSLRLNHPELTDELSKLKFHEDGTLRRDHKGKRLVMRWSTELDMMNKIVLGMQAKKFKEIHGVEDVRDAMTNDELYLLDQIQNYNVILTRMGRGYYERKDLLERYMETLH